MTASRIDEALTMLDSTYRLDHEQQALLAAAQEEVAASRQRAEDLALLLRAALEEQLIRALPGAMRERGATFELHIVSTIYGLPAGPDGAPLLTDAARAALKGD